MKETGKAAAAFQEYLLLGPDRSVQKLAQNRSKNGAKQQRATSQLFLWSTKYNWVERAQQYDAERAAERLRQQEEEIDAMNKRQWELARLHQELAHQRIMELLANGRMGSQATIQWLKNSSELERLARGAATERAEKTGTAETVIICETQWRTERLPVPERPIVAAASTDTELVMHATFGGQEEDESDG